MEATRRGMEDSSGDCSGATGSGFPRAWSTPWGEGRGGAPQRIVRRARVLGEFVLSVFGRPRACVLFVSAFCDFYSRDVGDLTARYLSIQVGRSRAQDPTSAGAGVPAANVERLATTTAGTIETTPSSGPDIGRRGGGTSTGLWRETKATADFRRREGQADAERQHSGDCFPR